MLKRTDRVRLGSSGLTTTVLGIGTVPLGNYLSPLSEEEAHATVDQAWNLGIRLFDTAPLYGAGMAERRLGEALASRPRDEYVLSTKVGRLLRANVPPAQEQFAGPGGKGIFVDTPNLNIMYDYSYDGVMRSLTESLERMGLDRVDLVLVHDPDNFPEFYRQTIEETFPALEKLRSDGTISGIGVGINQAEMLVDFVNDADFDCFLLAGRYSLLDHQSTLACGLLDVAKAHDIGIMLGGVYNSGILAKPQSATTFEYDVAPTEIVGRAKLLQAVCDRHNVPLMAAAIQFPLAEPGITTVLSGVRTPEEIEQNVEMLEFGIPVELWQDLRSERMIADGAATPG